MIRILGVVTASLAILYCSFVARANCDQDLNHVCPVLELGPTNGTTLYYALKHTGRTCSIAEPVLYEAATSGLFGLCTEPCDADDCESLNKTTPSEARSPAAALSSPAEPSSALQPIPDETPDRGRELDAPALNGRTFTNVSVPVNVHPVPFDFHFKNDGVSRPGATFTSLGPPMHFKICRNASCDDPRYVRVFCFCYERPGRMTIVAVGFECERPVGDAPRFIGQIRRTRILDGRTKNTKATNDYVEMLLGSTRFYVRVEDARDWL